MDAKELIQRASAAESTRSQIQGYIDAAYDYAVPWRRSTSRGEIMPKLMDGTGPRAVANFAGHLSNSLIPPESKFFELRAGDLIKHAGGDEAEKVDKENELATDLLHFILRAAGLDVATNEMCCDLAISTGAMFMSQGNRNNPIRIVAVPAHQLAIELGGFGMHEAWHWKRSVTARIILREFPNGKFSDEIIKAAKDNSDKEFEILQSTVWVDAENVFKTYAVIQTNIVSETTQRAAPWITPRYWAMPQFPWGIGPLLLALPDIRSLNKSVEQILEAAALALKPPYMVEEDGIINPDAIEISESALIRVKSTPSNQYRAPIVPLNMGSRVDLGQLMVDDMRSSIRETLLHNSLPPETGAVRSPTEIIKRDLQEQKITAGAFGRLQREFVQPIVARAIDICDRLNIPGIDWKKLRPNSFLTKVKIVSPMARAVEMGDAVNFTNFVSVLAQMGGQELATLMVDLEAQAPWIADLMGVPARTIRSSEARAQVKEQAAQMQQQMAEQQLKEKQIDAGQAPMGTPAEPPVMDMLAGY